MDKLFEFYRLHIESSRFINKIKIIIITYIFSYIFRISLSLLHLYKLFI